MPDALDEALSNFTTANRFKTKGPLCVALVVTQHAHKRGMPLDSEKLLTGAGGQVLSLGKAAVQSILNRHDINRVLASEGGRTSRGSIANMRAYVAFLNDLYAKDILDLDRIEAYWIARVHDFFASKPFKIRFDPSRSLRTVIRGVIIQAEERQKTAPGTQYSGAVLQHLVGAKLDVLLGVGSVEHNSYSTSDEQSGRAGDFLLADVAIHVTTSPGEAVIDRCRENLDDGLRPVLITTQRGLTAAEVHAENKDLGERIDVFEIEQFVVLNLYELGRFVPKDRRATLHNIVERYNEIVEEVETDPSLRIEFTR